VVLPVPGGPTGSPMRAGPARSGPGAAAPRRAGGPGHHLVEGTGAHPCGEGSLTGQSLVEGGGEQVIGALGHSRSGYARSPPGRRLHDRRRPLSRIVTCGTSCWRRPVPGAAHRTPHIERRRASGNARRDPRAGSAGYRGCPPRRRCLFAERPGRRVGPPPGPRTRHGRRPTLRFCLDDPAATGGSPEDGGWRGRG